MREKYIDSWFSLLREADPAYGVPLVVAGLVLMFIGWQLHKVAVPLIFLLVGIIAGIVFFESLTARLIAGGILGIGLAIVSNFEMRYSVAVLGGIVTAFAISAYLTTFPAVMTQTMILWVAAGVSFMGGAAISFVMFREMAVVVTSFVGALLLVSGLTAAMPQTMPNLYRTISTFIGDYPAFLVPFMIGGPTVIAVLVQLAGANRSDAAAT